MSDEPEPACHFGKVMKVVYVDDDNRVVHVRLEDGNSGRVSHLAGDLPRRGDIIIIGDNRWERAPREQWLESTMVAVVRSLLEDDSVIVDGSLGIKVIPNPRSVDVRVNNTIEYTVFDGLLRVVAETPIRSGSLGIDVEDIRNQYLVSRSGDALSFDDFGGYPLVKERARELIETQLERRDLLETINARPVKGILFTGPPGTGKTHLARIIAHQANADFYLVSGPSIVSKWLGDTEETLRMIFQSAAASEAGKAIIFFDEIDSIAERRSGDSHEASKRLVAQLLTEMDGFDETGKSVIVIAATNRAEVLDPALTRPGRFDWEIVFGMPTLQDRLEILTVSVRQLTTADELPLEDLAVLSEGWSAADLTSIWTEAALVAAGDNRAEIAAEDVALAFERVASRPRHALVEDVF